MIGDFFIYMNDENQSTKLLCPVIVSASILLEHFSLTIVSIHLDY